jgi:hypothetical protein
MNPDTVVGERLNNMLKLRISKPMFRDAVE